MAHDRLAELLTEPAQTATCPHGQPHSLPHDDPRPAEIRRRHPRTPGRIALMSQRTEDLLTAVDRLSYPHRMRELASAARRAAAMGAVDELVTGLAAHGVHGRRLAATVADMARIWRAASRTPTASPAPPRSGRCSRGGSRTPP